MDVVCGLREFGCEVTIYDPWANPDDLRREYGLVSINRQSRIRKGIFDAVVLAVSHREFAAMNVREYGKNICVVYDIKGMLPREVVDGRL